MTYELQATRFEVTLAALREHGACVDGYNKVVRSLQGRPFSDEDEERESYIHFRHDAPIKLIDILKSNGIDDALWALRCVPDVDRDARLFAVWCARQVQRLMTDQRSIDALDVAERFANGEASGEELDAAKDASWYSAMGSDRAAARAAAWYSAMDSARSAAWAGAWAAAKAAAWDSARASQTEMFLAMCEGRAPWQMHAVSQGETA